jgi:hypothetical protein
MRLRIPGLSVEEARAVGHDVARLLSEQLPSSQRTRHLGALDLRANIAQGTPRERLAELIVQAIKKSLA